jgi:hypothetical protein
MQTDKTSLYDISRDRYKIKMKPNQSKAKEQEGLEQYNYDRWIDSLEYFELTRGR